MNNPSKVSLTSRSVLAKPGLIIDFDPANGALQLLTFSPSKEGKESLFNHIPNLFFQLSMIFLEVQNV